jgi:hypothetical protein
MSRTSAARLWERAEPALVAREHGAGLRQAATAAGVHVATLCRWMAKDRLLREAFADAQAQARHVRCAWLRRQRPWVPWRRDCPFCGSVVEVRTTEAMVRFWRCRRWPACPFASWRPRAPGDCPRCLGPRWWSHSRKSVACPRCGTREYANHRTLTPTHCLPARATTRQAFRGQG